jgi:hypothetical protein
LWFEVVPHEKVDDVCASVWRPDGIQASAAKLYSLLCERYVGISHADCASFVAQQQSKQLSLSNAVQDKIIAPSQPTEVGQRWESDLTFTDSTIPSEPHIGFMSTIDSLSRYLWCSPIVSKNAAGIAASFEALFSTFGAPRKLQLDSSLENRSSTVKLVCQRHGVALVFTQPHSSSQQGGAERVHRTIKEKLRVAVLDLAKDGARVDFPALLESVVASYNRTVHSVTGLTPFAVMFGRDARLPGAVLMTQLDGPVRTPRAGSAGRAGSVAGQSLVTRVSAGRRAAVELRDLRGASTTDISGARNRRAPSLALGIERQPLRDERPRLLKRMTPIEAARERLGIREPAQQVLPRSAGAGAGAGAGEGAAAIPASGKRVVQSIIAICYDERHDRLLYGVKYAPPYDGGAYDQWVPASDFGLTDAVMQAEAKRQKQLPVVFSTPWTGGSSVDPRRPIELAVILNEIERDQNDGQDARGVPIDDGGGQDEVEDAVPTPTLRRGPRRGRGGAGQPDFAVVVAEAVKAAMAAVELTKRQGASASAMEGLRAEFEEEEEEEEGAGRGGGRGRLFQRRDGGRR